MPKKAKAAAGSADALKKVKKQLAESKKELAKTKKTLKAEMSNMKAELTAKMNMAVAEAYAKGFDKALTESKKIEMAREKAIDAAIKKFEKSNKLKAPAIKKTAKKTKAKAKKASKTRTAGKKKAASKTDADMNFSDSSMAA